MNRYTHPDIDATIVLACLAVAVVLILCGGCSWGVNDRLAYQAKRAEVVATEIRAAAAKARAEITASGVEIPSPSAEVIAAEFVRIDELSVDGAKAAIVLQLYHGTPPDLKVVLRDARDNIEVPSMAGEAMRRVSKAKWLGDRIKRGLQIVAEYASTFAATTTREVIKAFIPWWVWPIVAVLGAVVVVIGLIVLWHRWVVVPRMKADLELSERALDEADDGIEMLPPVIRRWIGKGRAYLGLAHAPRNAKRKAEVRAFEESVITAPDGSGLDRIAAENERLRAEKAEADERTKQLREIQRVLEETPATEDPGKTQPQLKP